jgi:arylsulfatase A-like enzyme
MTRRTLLITAPAASLFAQRRRPPNLVLILADDFGYECAGANGSLDYRTPRLDALAAGGVRFTHAHSTPLCTPTRVQLMTGKYNQRNYTEFGSLPPGERTFAHLLRDAGYRTGVAGKWQLAGAIEGTNYKGVGQTPEEAGFDEHCLWQVKARGSRYWDPLLQVNGELPLVQKGAYGPDVFARFAESFIERHRERPFFFYYPMALTHDPFVPTPDSRGLAGADRSASNPRWFGDMVAHLDKIVGRVVDAVDRHDLGNDTLILFTGDNGTLPRITTRTVNGPVRGGKGGTTMAGTHVPLIARWKGRAPAGRVCKDLIDFTDFFPTLAAAAGARIPAAHPRDGRSFLPQVEGRRGEPREWIHCDYNPRWGESRKPARWVMNHRWKLYGDGRFFDLREDPAEERPLAPPPPEAQSTAREFDKVLARMATYARAR